MVGYNTLIVRILASSKILKIFLTIQRQNLRSNKVSPKHLLVNIIYIDCITYNVVVVLLWSTLSKLSKISLLSRESSTSLTTSYKVFRFQANLIHTTNLLIFLTSTSLIPPSSGKNVFKIEGILTKCTAASFFPTLKPFNKFLEASP